MTKATLCDFRKPEFGNRRRRGSLTRESPYVAAFVVALTLVTVIDPTTSVSASMESPSTSTEEAFSTAFQPSLDATSGIEVGLISVKIDTRNGSSEIFSSSLSGATSSSARNPDAISNTHENTLIASDAISTASSEATSPDVTSSDLELTTTHASGNTERSTTGKLFTTQSSTDHTVVTTDAEDTLSASSLSTNDHSNTDEAQSTASQTQQEVTSAPEISARSVTTGVSSSTSDDIASKHTEATASAITNLYSQQTTTPVSSNTDSTTGEVFTIRYSTDFTVTIDAEDTPSTSSLSTSDHSSTYDVHSTASQSYPEVTSGSGVGDSSVTTGASLSPSDAISNALSEAASPSITNPDSAQSTTSVSVKTNVITAGELFTTQSSTDHTVVTISVKDTSSTFRLFTSDPSSTNDAHSIASQPHAEVTSRSGVDDPSVARDASSSFSDPVSTASSNITSPVSTNPGSEQSTSLVSSSTEKSATGEFSTTQFLTDHTVVTTNTEDTSSTSIVSTSDPSSTNDVQSTASHTHQVVTSASEIGHSPVTTDASLSPSDATSYTLSEVTSSAITIPDYEQTTTHVSGNTAESTAGEFFTTRSSTGHISFISFITDAENLSSASSLFTSDLSSTNDVRSKASQPHPEVTSKSGFDDTSVKTDASPSSSDAIFTASSEATSPAITNPDSEHSTSLISGSTEKSERGEFWTTQPLTDHTVVTTEEKYTSSTPSMSNSDHSSTDDVHSTTSQPHPEVTSGSVVDDTSVTKDSSQSASDAISSTLTDATSPAVTNRDSVLSTTSFSANTDHFNTDDFATTQSLTDLTVFTSDKEVTSSLLLFSTTDLISTDYVYSTASQPHQDITSGSRVSDSSVTTDASSGFSDAILTASSEATLPAVTNPDLEQTTAHASGSTAVSTTGEFVITQSSTHHVAVVTTSTEDTSSASSLSTSDPSSTTTVQSTASHTHQEVTSASEIGHSPVTADASLSPSDAISSTRSEVTSPAITNPDYEQTTTPVSGNTAESTTGEFFTIRSSTDLTVVTLDKEDTSSVSGFFTSDPGSTHEIYSTASQANPETTSSSEIDNTSVITTTATQRDFISSTLSEATSSVITIPDSAKSTAVSKHTDSITVEESFTTQSSSGHTAETGNRSSVSGFSTSDLNSTDDILSTASPSHPEVTSGSEVSGTSVTTHGRENATDALLSTHSGDMSSAVTKPDFLQSTANASTSTYEITTVHSVSSSFYDNATIDGNTTPAEPIKYKVEGNVTFNLNYSLLRLESTREAFQEAVISTIRFISKATNGTIVEVLGVKAGSIIVDFRLESTSSLQAAQKNLQDAKAEDFKNHLVIEARNSKSLDDIFEYIAKMDPPKINIIETHTSSPTGPNSAIENWLIAVIIIAAIVPLAAIIVVIRCVRKRGAKQPSERDEERHRQPTFAGGSRNTMDYEMEGGSRNVMYYTKASGNRDAMDSEMVRAPKSRNYGTRHDSLESESSRGPGDLRPPIGAAAIDKPRRSADYDHHSERPRGRLDYQDESRPPTERLMQRNLPYTGDYPWRDALADLVAAGRSASFDSRRSVTEDARYAGGPWRPNSDTRENTSVRQYQPMTSFPRQLITFGQNQESGFPRESSRAFPRLVRTRSWSRPAADYEG